MEKTLDEKTMHIRERLLQEIIKDGAYSNVYTDKKIVAKNYSKEQLKERRCKTILIEI